MNLEKLKGVLPAALTPFDHNDKINEKAFEQLLKLNIQKDVNGFYIGGSTAEAFLLSLEERKQLFQVAKSVVRNTKVLIAHVGCIGTSHAIELAKYAKELGYDAISSVAPFYYKFTFEEIKKYYFDIVNAVDMPMVVYNFPKFSGVSLSVENIAEFFEDIRFIALKHTSVDYYALERVKTAFPDRIVYNGFDQTFLAGLAMGADGGIGSTYNFMSEKFVSIYKLFREGRVEEAQEIQRIANHVLDDLRKVGVMQGEKAMLEIMGIDFGICRPPFKAISCEQKRFLEDVAKKYL